MIYYCCKSDFLLRNGGEADQINELFRCVSVWEDDFTNGEE